MIPIIGVMVGLYIIVRMVSFIGRRGERNEPALVKALAAVTIAVSILGILSLMDAGGLSLSDVVG